MTQLIDMPNQARPVSPFLKWAGGKRWLTNNYSQLFEKKFDRYIEPFLGSGAVFFHVRPKRAILSDVNSDLIASYNAVKSRRLQLEMLLREHHNRHSLDYYYATRSIRPRSALERAARLIYLNRTCWNGLYRVNKKGEFNVPIGTKGSVFMDGDSLLENSRALQAAEIKVQDFELTLDMAGQGDLVFVDPPYTVRHDNNGFIKYNERIFSWADQIRLAESLRRASSRGAMLLMTNANHESVRMLYPEFYQHKVRRSSILAGRASARGEAEELLVSNFSLNL